MAICVEKTSKGIWVVEIVEHGETVWTGGGYKSASAARRAAGEELERRAKARAYNARVMSPPRW